MNEDYYVKSFFRNRDLNPSLQLRAGMPTATLKRKMNQPKSQQLIFLRETGVSPWIKTKVLK